ncbi:MAG: PA0069 family radical SAM protein [Myxococcales bacterium]
MRRAESNPRNRFQEAHLEWLEEPPEVELEIQEVESKSILSRNDSPDLSFSYSANPYQGCYHGCAYCYARPTHQYLGMGAGTDFERKLMVKTNAPALLREAFAKRSWRGECVVFSGNTDCYQPLEANYRLTRQCLEVCLEHRNPVAVITKGGVVLRDVELLAELAKHCAVTVYLSVAFADDETRKLIEPFAAPIEKRFEAMRRLSEAGVTTGIALAPVIPGLNDAHVLPLLQRAKQAGAQQAFLTLVRLATEVKPVFLERIGQVLHPERVEKIVHALEEARDGNLSETRFGVRMRGRGKRWELIEQLFETQCRRLGLNQREVGTHRGPAQTFKRPTRQLGLFEE